MDGEGDSVRIPNSSRNLEKRVISLKKQSISCLGASGSKGLSQTFKCFTAVKQHIQGNATARGIAVFLLKTAALEVVRRFSRSRCTFIWNALQALQIFSYPPFKWIERLGIFKGFIKHTKVVCAALYVTFVNF